MLKGRKYVRDRSKILFAHVLYVRYTPLTLCNSMI